MNFLAHAYLSFGEKDILFGNMISDFVKGKRKFDYSPMVQNGIQLHRDIDTFTDLHVETKKAVAIFKPVYRLYAGAFIDIVYDHFLAQDNSIFPDSKLQQFSAQTYLKLEENIVHFPDIFSMMFPYMKTQNWLFNYQFHWAIKNSFNNLVKRATYIDDATAAYTLFKDNYSTLKACYEAFMPDVTAMAYNKFKETQL